MTPTGWFGLAHAYQSVMAPFNDVLQSGGYRVASVSMEKMGVARFPEAPGYAGPAFSGKVSYDAMVWLHLERR